MNNEERNKMIDELIAKVKRGDEKALITLYNHCKDYFKAYYITNYTVNDELMADLCQDLYIAMLPLIRQYNSSRAPFMVYISFAFQTIISNRTYDLVRQSYHVKKSFNYSELDSITSLPLIENTIISKYNNEHTNYQLNKEMEKLTEVEKIIIFCFYGVIDMNGMDITQANIAKYLYGYGYTSKLINYNTVAKYLAGAQKKLNINPSFGKNKNKK